jgi:protein arginine N-methyltransferase 1
MPPRTTEQLAHLPSPSSQRTAPASVSRPHLYVVSAEKTDEDAMLGQFIPIHYHYQMLDQEPRIGPFEKAIAAVVKPGMKVLELGAGTGVLSFFAARAGASKVYAVERVPHVARAAQRFLAANGVADRVEIINADATDYLPPERVDVVICEMLHTAMLREKQLTVIASFKKRYRDHFGGALPRFVPEGAVMAVQPVHTSYDFHGYNAPVPMFIDGNNARRVTRIAPPALYAMFAYEDDYATHFEVDEHVVMEQTGMLDSLRFITKNLLAIVTGATVEEQCSIDWDMQDLVVPLANPLAVTAGDVVRIRFRYDAGDSLLALAESIDSDD